MPYIKEHSIKIIETKGNIEDVIGEHVTLTRAGKDLLGECPFCNSKKKFSVSKVKNIWKCWSCDSAGVGYVQFVRKIKNITYPETLEFLAAELNIIVDYEENQPIEQTPTKALPAHKQPKADKRESFKDIQLRESGLTEADVIYYKKADNGDATIEISRYQKGSINPDWSVDINGDDMVMHYMDLNGHPMIYFRKNFTKPSNLIRVRFANPSVHTDKNGRPMKYQSPYGSGTHVWINQTIRSYYENGTRIETLYIQEGEKKADKATKHGLPSIGIMGIHNIASNKQLPREFELIIKRCDVKNVVFMVDGDYLDLSTDTTQPVDRRPKSFLRAIMNFRDYFYALNNSGISLGIYFGYVRLDQEQKGIDDLLVNKLKKVENLLVEDIKKTLLEPTGVGKYCNIHKITNYDEYKLRKEHFHMETNQAFAKHYYEELKTRSLFKIGRENFKFSNKTDNPELPEDTLILAQPLSAELEFWEEKTKKRGDQVEIETKFRYVECRAFLENRRFGKYKPREDMDFEYIKIDNSIVRKVDTPYIKEYIVDFVRYALQKKNVLEMLYKGSRMYLNNDMFSNIEYIKLDIHKSGKGLQYMYFKDTYWKITENGIDEQQFDELNGHVWQDRIKDIKVKKLPQLIKVNNNNGKYTLEFPNGVDLVKKCHFFRYLMNTSNFYWRDTNEGYYSQKAEEDKAPAIPLDEFKQNDITMHFISKCVALGFLRHTYFDPNKAKAVVAMDGKLSEVGSSHGRSGKSLFGEAVKELIPTFLIDGKQKDIAEDKFLLDGIVDTTQAVFIDDVRPNIEFERFFTLINGYWRINPKGMKSFTLNRETSPKILITTNHALNGEGGSFTDRQFLIAYSDYYNENYRPVDDFGCLFFDEWDYEQYNLFYNLVANCLQIYFEHGLVEAPMDRIEQRRLRQQIGEAMIDWAESFYDPEKESSSLGDGGNNINRAIERNICYTDFIANFPQQSRYTDSRKFKKLLQKWCEYKGYEFNPGAEKGFDKRNGKEFFTVANDQYVKDKKQF